MDISEKVVSKYNSLGKVPVCTVKGKC